MTPTLKEPPVLAQRSPTDNLYRYIAAMRVSFARSCRRQIRANPANN